MANHKNTTQSVDKRFKRQDASEPSTMNATYNSIFGGFAVKRIRTPHPHDVLSGRGGGINSHPGNVHFRAWVATRKNEYNLAHNKHEKARVAREVIDMVKNQDPPGRFLQKDLTAVGGGNWWIEVDDEKMMAKTSQALREGAPQIRAAHKDELEDSHPQHTPARRSRRMVESSTTPSSSVKRDIGYVEPDDIPVVLQDLARERALAELQANMEAATTATVESDYEPPAKRVRVEYNGQTIRPTDATPPLLPAEAPRIVPLDPMLFPEPLVMKNGGHMKRTHSLALSDLSTGDWNAQEEFVNPFADESDMEPKSENSAPPKPGMLRESGRQSSISSDMGGYGALLRSYDSSSSSRNSSGSFSNRNNIANMSSRSLTSVLSDLPDALGPHTQDTDFSDGMKTIYDALHPDVDEEEETHTHLSPYRAKSFRRSSANLLNRVHLGSPQQ